MPGAQDTIEGALATIASWEAEERALHLARASDLDDQIARLEVDLGRITEQLGGLRAMRGEMEQAAEEAVSGLSGRGYGLLFEVLERQATDLAHRAGALGNMRAERLASLEHTLRHSDAAPLMAEYEQFIETVAPTLDRLPESYRSVMLSHHRVVVEKLRQRIGGWLVAPSEAAEEPLLIDVCFAYEAPIDDPGVLVVVVPVEGDCYLKWREREGDVQLALAARVVQALYETLAVTGPVGVEVVAGTHAGLLVLEADVSEAASSIAGLFEARLRAVLEACRDLQGAGIRASVTRVPVDYVFPPVEEPDAPPAAAAVVSMALAVGEPYVD